MVGYLFKRFIEIVRDEGPSAALVSTARYVKNRYNRIRRGLYLYSLRLRSGEWRIICEINGSEMELDIHPKSPNKLERTLATQGIREPGATNTFRDVLNALKQDFSKIHVFDIGANIGYFALLEADTLGSQGSIYAIEAEPNNSERLKNNVELNNYSNIEVFQIAAGAEREQSKLSVSSLSNTHKMSDIDGIEGVKYKESISVETYTVDSLVSEREIPEDELLIVRMDVEGYEGYVFEGMTELLRSNRPLYLFVEVHPNREAVVPEEIAELLARGGFQPEYVSFDGGNTYQQMESLDELRGIESNTQIMVKKNID